MAESTGLQDAVRELDRAIANVNGGAIALANSGTRRRSCAGVVAAGRLAAMCLGVGQGIAMVIEA
jgi:acetyl-CoA acetyltransferase